MRWGCEEGEVIRLITDVQKMVLMKEEYGIENINFRS